METSPCVNQDERHVTLNTQQSFHSQLFSQQTNEMYFRVRNWI